MDHCDDGGGGVDEGDGYDSSSEASSDRACRKIISQQALSQAKVLGLTIESDALELASDVTLQYSVKALGRDLELFARHAGRSIVNEDDVILCARNSPQLRQELERIRNARLAGRKKRSV